MSKRLLIRRARWSHAERADNRPYHLYVEPSLSFAFDPLIILTVAAVCSICLELFCCVRSTSQGRLFFFEKSSSKAVLFRRL